MKNCSSTRRINVSDFNRVMKSRTSLQVFDQIETLIDANSNESVQAAALIQSFLVERILVMRINLSASRKIGYTEGYNDSIDQILKIISSNRYTHVHKDNQGRFLDVIKGIIDENYQDSSNAGELIIKHLVGYISKELIIVKDKRSVGYTDGYNDSVNLILKLISSTEIKRSKAR